ncbi:MAG TPA: hypothetical protein VHY91_18495 [Pirellulales bacterium]|jgi:hypothetical protein|nr:hypothetical protein [Pirellulales bacterium]
MPSQPSPQTTPDKPTAPVAASANPAATAVGVQLYFSQATETGCRVHAVCEPAEPAAVVPQAFLYGPESPYAATLRTRYPFGHRPGAADKPAEAWIAEPCFWSPAAPYVYRYEFRVSPAAAPVAGLFGIRRLAVQGDHLVFDHKHWVLRGARAEPLGQTASGDFSLGRSDQGFPLAAWHETPLAAAVENPPDRLCELASRLGVLLVARVAADGDFAAELCRLSRWPAVGIVILTAPPSDDDPPGHARNLLFAQFVSAQAALEPAAWAQLLFCEVADPADFVRKIAGCRLPIVAVRPADDSLSPAEARGACDRLQRDLAAKGLQMAGYVAS